MKGLADRFVSGARKETTKYQKKVEERNLCIRRKKQDSIVNVYCMVNMCQVLQKAVRDTEITADVITGNFLKAFKKIDIPLSRLARKKERSANTHNIINKKVNIITCMEENFKILISCIDLCL